MKEWYAKFRNNSSKEEFGMRRLMSRKEAKAMLATVGMTRGYLTLLEFWEIK